MTTQQSTRQGPSTRNKILAAFLVVGFVAVAAGVIGAQLGAGSDKPTTAAATGTPLPNAEFALFDGSSARFSDYQGRPLVINFWASWCPSCVAEMSAAFRPVQERLGGDVQFLGLDTQDERQAALRLVEETGVLFDLGEDPDGALFVELGGLGMPFTLFVTPDGRVVEQHNGPLTESQLETMIEELLLS